MLKNTNLKHPKWNTLDIEVGVRSLSVFFEGIVVRISDAFQVAIMTGEHHSDPPTGWAASKTVQGVAFVLRFTPNTGFRGGDVGVLLQIAVIYGLRCMPNEALAHKSAKIGQPCGYLGGIFV